MGYLAQKYPNHCIESPILMDYLIYRVIGKEFCKEKLTFFECETGKHKFKWHSSSNRTCQICFVILNIFQPVYFQP